MGSSRVKCEIVEAKDELSSVRKSQISRHVRVQDRELRPPTMKKANKKAVEEDINRLFDSVNLRACKSLDLSDSWRNASKKPIRATGSHSPGIGFSEPVPLKQALRGLCISQAAEVAAMKRLSMQSASPRVSEAGKITTLYRSVVVEAGKSGSSSAAEGRDSQSEISHLTEESTSDSPVSLTKYSQDAIKKPATKSSCSSPSYSNKPSVDVIQSIRESSHLEAQGRENATEISLLEGETTTRAKRLPEHRQEPVTGSIDQIVNSSAVHVPTALLVKDEEPNFASKDISHASEADEQPLQIACSQEETHDFLSAQAHGSCNDNAPMPNEKMSGLSKVAIARGNDSASHLKVVNKTESKVRRKAKLQIAASSTAMRSYRNVKSMRNSSRSVRPVIRNKNFVIKKSKKVATSIDAKSKTSSEESNDPGHRSGQLVCQRCQCSLRAESNNPTETDVPGEFTGNSINTEKSESIASGWENAATHGVKTSMKPPKSNEKVDISQSSKSSLCDFSSSTTSLSEESSSNGSVCGSRPHMSKDMRWQEINTIKKHCGFLGLNHFNLLKKLGSGDIGTVYLAELIGTNYPFAIKVMDNEFLARRNKLPRAQTEREILKMLDHPFLPTLYAQFTSDNLSCLVMEFCPGGDLHVLRQKQPGRYFPEQAARFYVAEVLLALEYLHMLGIVYRDLKPENILVREDGHIMLTDFDLSLRCSVNPTLIKSSSLGLEPPRVSGPCAGSNCIDPLCSGPSCKVSCFSPRLIPANARARKLKADAATHSRLLPQLVAEPTEARSNSFVGTHEYLAPEIIKGDGHGSAVDWWTFGVLLYELLYGKTPFKGAGNEETLTNVVLQSLRFPDTSFVSFQARDLIRGLLMKEPEHRLGTETGAAEIKRHPFFEGLNWALIRCAVPPQVPESSYVGNAYVASKGKRFEYNGDSGEHLEFNLF